MFKIHTLVWDSQKENEDREKDNSTSNHQHQDQEKTNFNCDNETHLCLDCKRFFKSSGGLKNHSRHCKEKNIVPAATQSGLTLHLKACTRKATNISSCINNSQRLLTENNATLISTDVFKMNPLQGDLMPGKTEQTNIHQHNGQEQQFVMDNNSYRYQIIHAYEEIVYMKRNLFDLPKCANGKKFLREMTRLINEWSSKSPDRDICLKAVMIMPSLLLQKVSVKSTHAENKRHLERRLQLWKDAQIEELLMETSAIQRRLADNNKRNMNNEEVARRFSKLMMQGKVNPAIRLLNEESTGVLDLTDETMQGLLQKHPPASPINDDMILQGPSFPVNSIIYDNINASLIQKCAIKTKGAAGPSGLDADFWRRAIGSKIFGNVSDDLCHAIALMARQLCSDDLEDPESISALMSCRLIPLDKCPGIRPIGIGEVLRRIIGKAVVSILKPDILNSTGYTQLCAGQEAGCEVAVHCVNDLFQSDENHGFIQIDASNAFNSINRNILLSNIKIVCPEIATYIINCYIRPARLFVMGGKEITSSEGTTQGDPIAMSMYAIGPYASSNDSRI